MTGFSDVVFSYRTPQRIKSVFSNCTHQFIEHKLHAVIGRSGCGKTTMLYLLAGLLRPDAGTVQTPASTGAGSGRCALILQDYGLLEWKTVRENISLGLVIARLGHDRIAAAVDAIMEETDVLDLQHAYPSQLSGGEKQRCAIARALVATPDLLLMDEPFSALDAMTRESMQDLLLRVSRSRSITIIMVTHSIEEAVYLADVIHVMHQDAHDGMENQRPARFLPPVENTRLYATDSSWRTSKEWFATCVQVRRLLEQEEHA